MYLLTKSETLNTGVTVSFTSGTDTSNIIDGDRTTNAETADRDPNLTINLGSQKVVNALWLRGENLKDYDLQASNNNINYTTIRTGETVTDGIYSFVLFANTTAYRYWRLAFSRRGASDPNYRVAEVFLMRLLLDLNTDEKRPLHYRPSIPRDVVLWRMRPITGNACPVQHGRRGENHAHLSVGVPGHRCCRCARITLERGAPRSRAHGLPAS